MQLNKKRRTPSVPGRHLSKSRGPAVDDGGEADDEGLDDEEEEEEEWKGTQSSMSLHLSLLSRLLGINERRTGLGACHLQPRH